MEESKVRKWATRIVGALRCLLRKCVSHRTLKPENVLFNAEGKIVLSDYGLAELLFSADSPPATGEDADVGALGKVLSEVCSLPREKGSVATAVYDLGLWRVFAKMILEKPPLATLPFARDAWVEGTSEFVKEAATRRAKGYIEAAIPLTDPKKAAELYRSAIEEYKNARVKSVSTAEAYNNLGILLGDDRTQARRCYTKSLKIYHRLGVEGEGLASVLNNLGTVADSKDEARDLYLRCIWVCNKAGVDCVAKAHAFSNLGYIAGNVSEMLETHISAVKLYDQLGVESETVANTLHNIGAICGNAAKSISYYERALSMFERLRVESETAAHTYNNLGILCDGAEKSERLYRKAITIYDRLGLETEAVANSHTNMGTVCKDKNEALKHYTRAMEICRKLNLDNATAANAYNNMGILAGSKQEAREYYQKAADINSRIDAETEGAANSYFNLGCQLEDRERVAALYRKARPIYLRLGVTDWRAKKIDDFMRGYDGKGAADEEKGKEKCVQF